MPGAARGKRVKKRVPVLALSNLPAPLAMPSYLLYAASSHTHPAGHQAGFIPWGGMPCSGAGVLWGAVLVPHLCGTPLLSGAHRRRCLHRRC